MAAVPTFTSPAEVRVSMSPATVLVTCRGTVPLANLTFSVPGGDAGEDADAAGRPRYSGLGFGFTSS